MKEGGIEKKNPPPNVDLQEKSETPQFTSLCASESF